MSRKIVRFCVLSCDEKGLIVEAKVFVRNELLPLQSKMKQLNDWLGKAVIRFEGYSLNEEE
ncbi:hypothetical protein [Xenorhabdus bovienii]|uniref:hypothetical protein n=1 Tax=Xenorhabdus bovienii TaxID=40576 RepID=UPI003DA24B0E